MLAIFNGQPSCCLVTTLTLALEDLSLLFRRSFFFALFLFYELSVSSSFLLNVDFQLFRIFFSYFFYSRVVSKSRLVSVVSLVLCFRLPVLRLFRSVAYAEIAISASLVAGLLRAEIGMHGVELFTAELRMQAESWLRKEQK